MLEVQGGRRVQPHWVQLGRRLRTEPSSGCKAYQCAGALRYARLKRRDSD